MKELVTLAWPITAAMLGETALGLCDTKLVGALGAAALGGVGMARMLLFLGYALDLRPDARGEGAHRVRRRARGAPRTRVRYAQAGAAPRRGGGRRHLGAPRAT